MTNGRRVIDGLAAEVLLGLMQGLDAKILHLERGGNGAVTASFWGAGGGRPLARNILVQQAEDIANERDSVAAAVIATHETALMREEARQRATREAAARSLAVARIEATQVGKRIRAVIQ